MACAPLALGAADGVAATPSTPYDVAGIVAPDPQLRSRVPERLSDARDLDGDGVSDIFASSYLLDVLGVEDTGGAYLFSGATRKLIYRLNPPQPQEGAHFGFYISVIGDVNADGLDDVAVGAESQDVGGNADQGRLYVFDGPSGRLLYHIDNPHPQADARFGSRIGAAGDVTGDGLADIITGATSNDLPAGCGNVSPVPIGCQENVGQAFVFDGSDGSLVRELNIPPADVPDECAPSVGHTTPLVPCGNLGGSPQGLGDMNGDGISEHMVAAYTLRPTPDQHGRIYVFSGASGAVLTRIDQPAPDPTAFFGLQDTDRFTPGDLNADGVPEVIGTGFQQDSEGGLRSAGRAWVFDGRASLQQGRGVVLYELEDPNPVEGKAFGWAHSKTDYNKDGRTDLYLSNLSGHNPGDTAPPATYVFDGRDGTLLRRLTLPPSLSQTTQGSNTGTGLGWSSRAPGDLNRDGEPDYVAAAPFQDVNGIQDVGETFFFLSNVPPTAPAAPPPAPQPPAPQPSAPQPSAAGKFPAKLAIARARIVRSERVLDVLAPITARASGRVRVQLHAANRKFRFTAQVNSADGRIRFRRRIPKAQAELGTGIITITYAGDADTRPQTVRLRAASQPAKLAVRRPTIAAGRLRASGSVTDLARGVVRLQLQYDYRGATRTIRFRARIQDDGEWTLNEQLSPTVLMGIAGRQGSLHSYTLFTGYFERRVRGEMRSFQVLGER